LAAYDWIRAQGVAPRRIIVIGQSLGNAPAAALASTRPIGGLVLVSPFISLPEAAFDKWPWLPVSTLLWPSNRFEAGSRLDRVSAPLLLIASRGDETVPIAHSRRVRELAHGRAHWIEDRSAPHDGLLAKVAADWRLTRGLRVIDFEIRYPDKR
jgi:pimeloyl-ACP methyl ester carboxylesterase